MNEPILLLETSTTLLSVGIVFKNGTFFLKELDHNSHAAQITILIQEVLAEAQISITDLVAVAVSSGPGSFTSLRIGFATAKGLCLGLNLPLLTIDTLSALAQAAAGTLATPQRVLAMVDARREEVYLGIFEGQPLQKIGDYHPFILDENSEAILQPDAVPLIICGSGALKTLKWLPKSDLRQPQHNASILCVPAQRAFAAKDFASVAHATPFYLKEPNITLPKIHKTL